MTTTGPKYTVSLVTKTGGQTTFEMAPDDLDDYHDIYSLLEFLNTRAVEERIFVTEECGDDTWRVIDEADVAYLFIALDGDINRAYAIDWAKTSEMRSHLMLRTNPNQMRHEEVNDDDI